MPTATTDDVREDFRFLSEIDTHHQALGRVTDGWFDRVGFTFVSYRRGRVPLAALALDYPAVCPIDALADTRIVYWLLNLEESDVRQMRGLAKTVKMVQDEMEANGSTRVWGSVPKTATHLLAFLDRMIDAGIGLRTDGADVPIDDDPADNYGNFIFYIGGRDEAGNFLGE